MSDYGQEKIEQTKLDIKLVEAKAGQITTRHRIWAVVCITALVGTVWIICNTIIELAKIGAK